MQYLILTAFWALTLSLCAAKDIPRFDESFSTKIVEVNGITTTIPTSADDALSVVVTETLVMDAQNRRKYLYAETSQGVMNQIQRCDLAPTAGYLMNAEGRPNQVNDPSKWSCTNTTIPVEAESADNCQYGTFWSELYTGKFEYKGTTGVNGLSCDTWQQIASPQQQLVVYAMSTIPYSTPKSNSPK